MHCFSTHFCNEFIWIFIRQILVIFWKSIQNIQVFFFSKKITIILSFICTDTRLYHHKTFIVNNAFLIS